GAHRLLLPCTLAIAAGFAVIAGGYVRSGTIIVILARALLGTAGPVLAAEKSTDRIAALASYATWTDVGLAAGAFFGIVGVAEIGYAASYTLLVILLVATAAWQIRSSPAVGRVPSGQGEYQTEFFFRSVHLSLVIHSVAL